MSWLYILLAGVALFFILVFAFGFLLSADGYDGPVSDHFDGKKFKNPNKLEAQNIGAVFKFLLNRKPEPWTENYERFVRSEPINANGPKDKVHIIFVNHSTFLIQFAGLNILTDPVWSSRCSPFQFAGPKRMRPPGIRYEDLPRIDLVLLSHNHYDHFDSSTLKKLKHDHDPTYIVPLGVMKLMQKYGIDKVVELDWHQSNTFEGVECFSVPANHFSARGMFDRDRTLWCGFILSSKDYKIYYVGDTGYGDNFKEIPKKYGSIDLSLIPIGAYKPEWFMGPIHISPPQAIQVHKDIQSKQSIAMHFGCFPLADDGMGVAEGNLEKEINASGMDPKLFLIPEEGESLYFDC